jgi:Arc/MetJ-type ribon-helix-helix transcriptional regulator
MAVQLSPENEAFIQEGLAAGVFVSRDEAIDAGVALLRERSRILEQIDEGTRQLAEGDYIELDEHSLGEYFEKLKANARDAARRNHGA